MKERKLREFITGTIALKPTRYTLFKQKEIPDEVTEINEKKST